MVSVDDLESLEETIAILSDGDAVAALLASEAELARGEIVSRAELVEAVGQQAPQRLVTDPDDETRHTLQDNPDRAASTHRGTA